LGRTTRSNTSDSDDVPDGLVEASGEQVPAREGQAGRQVEHPHQGGVGAQRRAEVIKLFVNR
jgi:hypothetical protein